MASLLLSDLHLPASASPLRDRFKAFLRGPARKAEAVYLLGDVFEHWIGDDIGLERYADIIADLAALTASQVPVYLMQGNRDFLLGSHFAAASGIQLMRDPAVISIDGERWLLSHGDQFCTDDLAYQRWRQVSRQPLVQFVFLKLPRVIRQRIAGGLRSHSREAKQEKPAAIMDVNSGAVEACLRDHDVRGLIHGHTHRPAEHHHQIAGHSYVRLVLSDWREDHCEYLEVASGQWRRVLIEPTL